MLRVIAILLLCFIIINLFVGLFYMLREGRGSKSNKVVRALTIRVVLSVVLFVLIVVSAQYDLIPN